MKACDGSVVGLGCCGDERRDEAAEAGSEREACCVCASVCVCVCESFMQQRFVLIRGEDRNK